MKVVAIDDAPDVIEVVSLCFELRWPGAIVLSGGDGATGLKLVEKENPDVVILDVGLPDMDGFEVLRQLRKFSNVPVVMLTVRDQEIDKVRGLELGADDYMTKPFSHIELLARVRSVLRRVRSDSAATEGSVVAGDFSMAFATREVWKSGKLANLTPIEYDILYHLVLNEGRALTHHVLLTKVWGQEYGQESCYLKVYIHRLREKLESDPQTPRMILTERGIGYKFIKPAS